MEYRTLKTFCADLWQQSPKEITDRVVRRIRGCSPLENFSSSFPCVFVLSTGRCGTKTLAALLNLADNLAADHEPAPRLYGLSRLAYADASGVHRDVLDEAVRSGRAELARHAMSRHLGYAETSPQLTFLAPSLDRTFPSARFIHLHRDPRAVVRSAMRRKWYQGNANDTWRIHPLEGDAIKAEWDEWSAFRKNVWLWAETNRWILDFTASVPAEHVLRLDAESLFAGDPKIVNRLYGFVGSRVPSTCRVRRVLGKQLNRQVSGSFKKPDDWDDEDVACLKREAGPVAGQLEYSL